MPKISTSGNVLADGTEAMQIHLDGVPILIVEWLPAGHGYSYSATVGTWTEDGEFLEIATAPQGDLEPALTLKEELLS